MQWLLVGLAGAIGTLLRYGLGLLLGRGSGFHWHTFTANVLGSFLIVLAAFWIKEHRLLGVDTRALLMTGVMGGLTTYSAFNLELLLYMERGEWLRASVYFVTTVLCCLLGGALGFWVARA